MFPRVIQAGSGIFSGRALACVVGEGQPVPALHRRKRQAVVKMANAKGLSLRGGQRPTWRPEREARGSALGVQSRSSRLHRGKVTGEIATAFPRLPRRFAPRNDTSGGYCGAPAPSSGLIPLCKALNERRYRRNRSVRFYRHLVRTGSAFPRLPRPLWGLAMTRQGSAAMGTVRRTELAVLLPLRGRAGHAPPLQGQYGLNGGRRMIHSSFFILQYSLFLISSIPLRGMANHMTKRPEIPCLSCKFPQSRRICH